MRRKNGKTLVEWLVIVAIVCVVGTMLIGGCNSVRTWTDQSFNAEVVRKYEVNKRIGEGSQTVYRVDIRRNGATEIETIENHDNLWRWKHNSATVHANLAEGKWYSFETTGSRNEWMSWFPNIINVKEIAPPNKTAKAEVDFP